MFIATVVLTASVTHLVNQPLLDRYWDCDTQWMKGQLSSSQVDHCIEFSQEVQRRVFLGNHSEFRLYWLQHRHYEWSLRGYYHDRTDIDQ